MNMFSSFIFSYAIDRCADNTTTLTLHSDPLRTRQLHLCNNLRLLAPKTFVHQSPLHWSNLSPTSVSSRMCDYWPVPIQSQLKHVTSAGLPSLLASTRDPITWNIPRMNQNSSQASTSPLLTAIASTAAHLGRRNKKIDWLRPRSLSLRWASAWLFRDATMADQPLQAYALPTELLHNVFELLGILDVLTSKTSCFKAVRLSETWRKAVGPCVVSKAMCRVAYQRTAWSQTIRYWITNRMISGHHSRSSQWFRKLPVYLAVLFNRPWRDRASELAFATCSSFDTPLHQRQVVTASLV